MRTRGRKHSSQWEVRGGSVAGVREGGRRMHCISGYLGGYKLFNSNYLGVLRYLILITWEAKSYLILIIWEA